MRSGLVSAICAAKLGEEPEVWSQLEVRDLSVSRGGRTILSAINLSLSAGNLLYVNGANGSGKTTLIGALAGLIEPDAGQIEWCGRSATGSPLFRSQMGYLAHNNGLHGDLTVAENLAYATRLGGNPLTGFLDQAINQALTSVGMKNIGDRPLRHLSQGQQRRVALARLLLKRARLWLLDEPFNSLDAESTDRFRDLLKAHLAQGGLVVASTHLPIAVDGVNTATMCL